MKNISYILVGISILFLFHFQLMASLIGGMAIYIIIKNLNNCIINKFHSTIASNITLIIIIFLLLSCLSFIGIGIYSGILVGKANFVNLFEDVFNIIQQLKTYLPISVIEYIPENIIQFKEHSFLLLKNNLPNVLTITTSSAKLLLHIIIGMIIGSIIAFNLIKKSNIKEQKPLALELTNRISLFSLVFQKVVFAQVKISFINTCLTGFFLLIIIPLLGYKIPYTTTLILLTFLLGLFPVVGNLMSNSLIVLLSLLVSFNIAIASLVFLIVIHKLEYYINAKIIGDKIQTSIWEMLIVMLILESVFGIIGAILGPVIYGYIKEELKLNNLI